LKGPASSDAARVDSLPSLAAHPLTHPVHQKHLGLSN
jgi:hypothetical protein